MKIAPHFYGYIKGVQYFKNLQIQKSPDYFTDASSTNTSLLFYFKFDQVSYEDYEFQNLALNERFDFDSAIFNDTITEINPDDETQYVVRRRTPQIIFDRLPFKQFYVDMQSGFQGNDIEWDGVTCAATKYNILLNESSQTMSLNFTNANEAEDTSSLFLQTWIKFERDSTVVSESPEAAESLISVTSLDTTDEYLSIVIQDLELWCVLYEGGEIVQSIKYKQFDSTSADWIHITCHFQGIDETEEELESYVNYNLLRGTLYLESSSEEYSYYSEATTSAATIEAFVQSRNNLELEGKSFTLVISGPNVSHQGISSISLQDIQIWNEVLTRRQVFVGRHQALADPSAHPNLLVHAPLTDGLFYPYKFYNHKTGKSFSTPELLPSTNTSSSSPLVCPAYSIYSYADKACVLDEFVAEREEDASESADSFIHMMKDREAGSKFVFNAESL